MWVKYNGSVWMGQLLTPFLSNLPTTGGILVGGEQDDVIGDRMDSDERDSELDESVQISIWKTGLRRENGIEELLLTSNIDLL
jgi:hypothetical protein